MCTAAQGPMRSAYHGALIRLFVQVCDKPAFKFKAELGLGGKYLREKLARGGL